MKKAELLQKAYELFTEQGYAQGSIQKLADSLGITKASLYHYFVSKAELLKKTCSYILDKHQEEFDPMHIFFVLKMIFEFTHDHKMGHFLQNTLLRLFVVSDSWDMPTMKKSKAWDEASITLLNKLEEIGK